MIGFGKESWCTDQLVTGRYATGWLIVAQALYRRLITPQGMLQWGEDESRYGFDLSGYVGAVGEDAALIALPSQVAAELAKDDRVSDVRAVVNTVDSGAGLLTILISVDVALKDEAGNFNLTMTVGQARTELVSVSEAA
jgi:hypothetical protein